MQLQTTNDNKSYLGYLLNKHNVLRFVSGPGRCVWRTGRRWRWRCRRCWASRVSPWAAATVLRCLQIQNREQFRAVSLGAVRDRDEGEMQDNWQAEIMLSMTVNKTTTWYLRSLGVYVLSHESLVFLRFWSLLFCLRTLESRPHQLMATTCVHYQR
jgi:hypothetical protein